MANVNDKPLPSVESSPTPGDQPSSTTPRDRDLSFFNGDSNSFKVFKCISEIGAKVLYIIFTWGYKGKTKNIWMYMNETGVFKITKLSDGQKLRLRRNEPPSTFDTTLLYTLLQTTCGLADRQTWNTRETGTPERILYEVKEYRNMAAHIITGLTHAGAKEKIQEIGKTYAEALDITGKAFGIEEEKIKEMKDQVQVDVIKLMCVEFNFPSPPHLPLANSLTNMIMGEGKNELKEFYNSQKNVKLALRIFESGRSAKEVPVDAIFADRDLLSDEDSLINAKDILSVRERWRSKNGVILITGCSGSGKTTLMKFLLHSWTEHKDDMKGILDYDLVLYKDCRISSISSLDQLVRARIPKTSDNIQDTEDLKTALAPLKVLLLLDGVGKLEGSTRDLILSVLSYNSLNLHTICTTRRSGCYSVIQEVCQMAGKDVVRIDLHDLSPYQRQDLMYNIIGEFGNEKLQTAGWNDMYSFLHSRGSWVASNFLSPLEVSLLTMLWLNSVDLVKTLPNGTSVLQHLEDFKTMWLIEKLAEEGPTKNVPMRILNSSTLNVMKTFNKIAYETLLQDGWRLSDSSLKEFRKSCTDNNLPYEGVLSVLTNIYVDLESQKLEIYTLSHNDLTSRSARHLCDQLESSPDMSISSLLPQYAEPYPKQRYHMLLLITGHLAQRGVLEKYAESIVNMAKAEDLLAAEWFQILVEGRSQSDLCAHVGKAMTSKGCLHWKIRDSMVEGTVQILETRSVVPRKIDLFLLSNPVTLPKFETLLELLSNEYENELNFELQHHYVSQSRSDEVFGTLYGEEGTRCKLTSFQGCLNPENIARLSKSLTWLCLRVNFFELHAVAELLPSLGSLTSLELLIDDPQLNRPSTYPTLTPNARVLVAIPRLRDADISWACEMLGAILQKEFYKIKLFGCELTFQGCKEFISGLKEAGVCIHHSGNLQMRFEKAMSPGRTRELVELAREQGYTLEVRKGG